MSDDTKSARNPGEGEAPLLPGGEPELAGTGPKGAYPDGSPSPGRTETDAQQRESRGRHADGEQ